MGAVRKLKLVEPAAPKRAAPKKSATVAVKIPRELAEKAEKLLNEQGANLETLVRLQIGAFCRTRVSMRLCDTMTFGKYIGERVEDIVRTDLKYIVYLLGLDGVSAKFATDVLALVESLMNKDNAPHD